MMCWLPWLCGVAAVWLSVLGYFVTGRYSTTVQDTANLTELAYSRLNVTDPLGWDVLDALKLLSGFLQKFGGIIDFTGSDLAEGHLSNGLCKSMGEIN